MLIFGMIMISIGSILPDISFKFSLNESSTGALLTFLPIGVMLGSILFGPLVDAMAYKRIIIGGTTLAILGTYGIGISNSLFLLYISVFLIGLGGGVLNGLTNALVSDISLGDPSADLSFLGIFYGIGALGTPMLFGILDGAFSFEVIFICLASILVLPLLFFIAINFPSAEEKRVVSLKKAFSMLADPILLLFGMILFFQSGIEGVTNNWTTTFLETSKTIPTATSLFILSAFVAALTLARIMLSRILRQYVPIKVMIVSFYLGLLGVIIIWLNEGAVIIGFGMCLVGMGMACGFPVVLGYIGQLYRELSGTAFSIVITIALIGNVIANYLMGIVSTYFGIEFLPFILILSIGIVLLLLYVLRRNYSEEVS